MPFIIFTKGIPPSDNTGQEVAAVTEGDPGRCKCSECNTRARHACSSEAVQMQVQSTVNGKKKEKKKTHTYVEELLLILRNSKETRSSRRNQARHSAVLHRKMEVDQVAPSQPIL